MPTPLVPVPSIQEAALCNPRPLLGRPYAVPFMTLYAIFLHYYKNHYERYFGGGEFTYVYFGGICSLQALLWLMPFWNIHIRMKFEYVYSDNVETAKRIKVVPNAQAGAPDICDLVRDSDNNISFMFQKRRFVYNRDTKAFLPAQFDIDREDAVVGTFQSAKGLSSDQINHLTQIYGQNKFDIPIPSFTELYKEHAVAPLFVFQMFCVALWFLDDMWWSALFNLVTILIFEGTVVFQRQRTIVQFRGMGVKHFTIKAFRNKKWIDLETTELLPGDIVSVVRSPEDSALPCDMALLHGACIVNEAMLSGESTPLLKESLESRPPTALVELEGLDKNSLLFGGTKVVKTEPAHNLPAWLKAPPNNGAVAVVTRTGFETTQGSLVRVMIFSTEKVGAGNMEAYFFILFLLVFALIASGYVWNEGVKMDRKRTKLLLECVRIITSVVPPELPMELTLSVNQSLAALSKFYIYCTEPFRLPFAGRMDVCCFDKTGTITQEELILEGLAGLGSEPFKVAELTDVPRKVAHTLAAAHALVLLEEDEVVGDPMEQQMVSKVNFKLVGDDEVQSINSPQERLRILKRFQFSSALKRSSSVALDPEGKVFVAVKGAPETIRHMLVSAPEGYDDIYKHFTREGSRVLAVAYKDTDLRVKQVVDYSRESAEAQLTFAGFLVFQCPLKPDAVETIKSLNESSHRVVMITGDNPLTAVKISADCKITERDTLILDEPEDGRSELEWYTVDEKTRIPCNPDEPLDYHLFKSYDLCLTGHAIKRLQDHEDLPDLIRHTWVYARVSPTQKEFILVTLKSLGYMTLMCGDGTNDVGALKQSHLGIALLNGTVEGMKKMEENNRFDAVKRMYEKQVELLARWNRPPPPVPAMIAHMYPPGRQNPHYIKAVEQRGGTIDEKTRKEIEKLKEEASLAKSPLTQQEQAEVRASEIADKLSSMMEDNEIEAPTLKLGDASVAAPMTSKLADVGSVVKIIRQGRCTLVATIQMYKILALNCLISAYSLSVLYLSGIKFSDYQSTASGILLAMCFMSISRGQPLEKLSKERPQPGIFNKYIMSSILCQFAVHITTLMYISSKVYEIEPQAKVDLEAKFSPSLLNTAVYLLQLVQEISTFAVNYQGRPFRQSITENKGMYYGVLGLFALAFACSTEFVPEMNEGLGLVPMSLGFKVKLNVVMILDLGLCIAFEYGFKYLFADFKPSDIALRLDERDSYVQYRKRTTDQRTTASTAPLETAS